MWKECITLSLSNRLAFSSKKNSFNDVNSKRIGDAFMRCLSFFYIPKELEGISGTRR